MRRLSLNTRRALDGDAPEEVHAVLMEIAHPGLAAPLRLSTDPTERLSTEPLTYGTRSGWRGADPRSDPYLFMVADALLPSDQQDAPAEARIALMNLDPGIAQLLRSFRDPASFRLAVVLASSPDLVEAEWADLRLTSAEIDASEIILTISREEIELEHYPGQRLSRSRFPGLFP
ncbi:hypothetical protein [Palleronia caenipelagi]|uniref:DUF1833 domain-containing protein n=1 Tax=Palleronia caenipelagi TaxID=2489174 RepID=A0A547PW53_9RHOB|nr:hypothetical protein [Palleronia caenipelagi]TRD18351.1 hypothetical protein FEV53_11895 [Palleronia caenipelagi]